MSNETAASITASSRGPAHRKIHQGAVSSRRRTSLLAMFSTCNHQSATTHSCQGVRQCTSSSIDYHCWPCSAPAITRQPQTGEKFGQQRCSQAAAGCTCPWWDAALSLDANTALVSARITRCRIQNPIRIPLLQVKLLMWVGTPVACPSNKHIQLRLSRSQALKTAICGLCAFPFAVMTSSDLDLSPKAQAQHGLTTSSDGRILQ